jgi:signal transduction histidine kinase
VAEGTNHLGYEPSRTALRSLFRRLFGIGYPGRLSGDPAPDVATLRLGLHAVETCSPAARALLGACARRGAPVDALRARIAAIDAVLLADFDRLRARGEAFRRRVQVDETRIYEISGGPAGGGCALGLRDVSAEAQAQRRAEREAAEARAEAEALRRALDAAGAAAWRLDPSDEPVWRSQAAGRGRAEADPPTRATTVRFALPDGGAVAVARGGPSADGADGALSRFVETVTETFAHLRTGLAIFDSDRRLTLANPAVAEIFGVGPDLLAGRPTLRQMLDRLREARLLPEQLDYPAWRAALFTLFDDVNRANYDERWELPDGRSIHVVGRPHPTGGIAFVFEDVTEAINARRWRLTAVETRRAMLDALEDGVIAFGPDGKTRLANPALMHIWRLGDNVEDAPRHVADFDVACGPLIAEGQIWRIVRDAVSGVHGEGPRHHRVRLTDGRVLSARIAQLPDGSTLAAFSDVTDSEQVADALRERAATIEAADQMRAAMLYQISHGLRTPLNAVIGFAELLAEGHVGPVPHPQASYLDNIRAASTAMLKGVESLTELVGAGAAPSLADEPQEIDLAPLLRGAVELLEGRLAERGVDVVLSPTVERARGRGDPARMRQLVYAALAEAAACARSGAAILVRVERDVGGLAIRCSGFEPPATESQPFAVARATAEMHGAVLALERDADGGASIVCRMAGAATGLPAADAAR